MKTIFNFGAGPAMIPRSVLEEVKAELLNWRETGISIMELGHRTELFQDLMAEVKKDLTELLKIPSNYRILFLAGGARGQFSAVPMNLLREGQVADYLVTGVWSEFAYDYAKAYGKTHMVASGKDLGFVSVPDKSQWSMTKGASYFYYCANETITGLFVKEPSQVVCPLVVDMTSNILSEPIDVSKYGIIFASAQKNLGSAGVTLVIIREDLLQDALPVTPEIFNYKTQVKENSCLNTPPTFPIYLLGLVAKWTLKEGGLPEMAKRCQQRSNTLYDFINTSDFYSNKVDPKFRSKINVTFSLPSDMLTEKFCEEAEQAGMIGLKGHRFLGGARASMYNAMPEEGAHQLLEFMESFIKKARI